MTRFGKTGVLLVNLGTPDDPGRSSVYTYLKQFLLDPRVIDYPWLPRNLLVRAIIAPFRSGSSSKLYKQLWTPEGSPLKVYGRKLEAGVRAQLGEDYVVELAMRYQSPSIESSVQKLIDAKVSDIIVLPLFPHYASASSGSVHEEIMRIFKKRGTIPNLRLINSFYDYEPLIDVFVENARKFDIDSYDHVLFSYHGVPKRHLLKSDEGCHCQKVDKCCETISIDNQFCYSAQCYETTYQIAAKLGLSRDRYTVCFQSRLGGGWIEPFSDKVIEALAAKGAKRLLAFSPAFVSDCLETTIEISTEYQEEFEEWGGEKIDLVPSLNDNPKWIKGVADLIRMNTVGVPI